MTFNVFDMEFSYLNDVLPPRAWKQKGARRGNERREKRERTAEMREKGTERTEPRPPAAARRPPGSEVQRGLRSGHAPQRMVWGAAPPR